MENIIPNLEWYTGLSKIREVQPRCPFASVETCPRYFQSLSLLGCAGSTSIDDREEKRLIDYWNKSELWPKTGEYETSLAGPKNNPRTFTNFCPETAYDRFGYFATFFAGYADEIDRDNAHATLSKRDAPANDWRWNWSLLTQLHYSDCHYYSILDHRSRNNRFPFSANEPVEKISFSPYIFQIPNVSVDPNLISVMMPFRSELSNVYEAIKEAANMAGFHCKRVDDIWDHSTVIQDVFSLIFQSYIVVCDLTGKNPNVFYEAGIAHTLGRHVVPITQSEGDIPFDLLHHRYAIYLNNGEGREKLKADLAMRFKTLASKRQ